MWKWYIFQNVEMFVVRYDKFRISHDSAINKFIVINISSNHIKRVCWVHQNSITTIHYDITNHLCKVWTDISSHNLNILFQNVI